MPKKSLIVEQSLAVRGIAESLLRQNGYDVLAANSIETAQEIIGTSRIDLILVSSEFKNEAGQRYFEMLGADTATAMMPLVVMHDPGSGGAVDLPVESVLVKPFTPREFMEKINTATGLRTDGPNPLTPGEVDLEDEIIDAALGLDKLEVSDASVVGSDTSKYRVQNRKVTTEAMIGYEYKASAEDSAITKKKIDEIRVPADSRPVDQPAPPEKTGEFLGADSGRLKSRPADTMSPSSKIEIVPDQYGMITPDEIADKVQATGEPGSHDYDWFIKEMRRLSGSEEDPSQVDSGSLHLAPTSEGLSPKAPPPPTAIPTSPPKQSPAAKSVSHAEAVGKFINEFKREIEKIATDSASPVTVTPVAPSHGGTSAEDFNWVEALEKISPSEIRTISKELIDAVADRVAERIVARLEPETVYQLLRECFSSALGSFLNSKAPRS